MKNLRFVVFITIFGMVVSFDSGAVFKGENLITKIYLTPPEWSYLTKNDDGIHSSVWVKDDGAMFSIMTFYGSGGESLDSYRNVIDSGGRSRCDKFTSSELSSALGKRRSFITWRTTCAMPGGNIVTLQKIMGGGESMYHMMRTWRYKVGDQEFKKWLQQYADTYVCDTRTASPPCPDI